jgi:hypothetical protein
MTPARPLALFCALASLAAPAFCSLSVNKRQSHLSRLQRNHPALYYQLALKNNNSEDSHRFLAQDDSQPGFGCVTSNNGTSTVDCHMQFGDGSYDLDETCTSNEAMSTLACSVCAKNNGIMLEDGSFVTFCYKFRCSISDNDVFANGDFSKACVCDQATVSGEVWYVCVCVCMYNW